MNCNENPGAKAAGRADVISAWLLVLLALVIMNTVLTFAAVPW